MSIRTHSLALIFFSLGFIQQASAASGASMVSCPKSAISSVPNVDMARVRSAWLSWYNEVRVGRKLQPYVYDANLDHSALLWSRHSANIAKSSHQREGTTAYYDYKAIERWFASLGLTFKNVSGTTFTENIGWGPYTCKKKDCTDELLKAIRTTFRFYVSEQHRKSNAHWKSMINPNFRKIGLGLVVKGGRYYLTVHFAAEITAIQNVTCAAGS